jgi:hypothetical protein
MTDINLMKRNEIWAHIDEHKLPVKKYHSTEKAREALTEYYNAQKSFTVLVVFPLLMFVFDILKVTAVTLIVFVLLVKKFWPAIKPKRDLGYVQELQFALGL